MNIIYSHKTLMALLILAILPIQATQMPLNSQSTKMYQCKNPNCPLLYEKGTSRKNCLHCNQARHAVNQQQGQSNQNIQGNAPILQQPHSYHTLTNTAQASHLAEQQIFSKCSQCFSQRQGAWQFCQNCGKEAVIFLGTEKKNIPLFVYLKKISQHQTQHSHTDQNPQTSSQPYRPQQQTTTSNKRLQALSQNTAMHYIENPKQYATQWKKRCYLPNQNYAIALRDMLGNNSTNLLFHFIHTPISIESLFELINHQGFTVIKAHSSGFRYGTQLNLYDDESKAKHSIEPGQILIHAKLLKKKYVTQNSKSKNCTNKDSNSTSLNEYKNIPSYIPILYKKALKESCPQFPNDLITLLASFLPMPSIFKPQPICILAQDEDYYDEDEDSNDSYCFPDRGSNSFQLFFSSKNKKKHLKQMTKQKLDHWTEMIALLNHPGTLKIKTNSSAQTSHYFTINLMLQDYLTQSLIKDHLKKQQSITLKITSPFLNENCQQQNTTIKANKNWYINDLIHILIKHYELHKIYRFLHTESTHYTLTRITKNNKVQYICPDTTIRENSIENNTTLQLAPLDNICI